MKDRDLRDGQKSQFLSHRDDLLVNSVLYLKALRSTHTKKEISFFFKKSWLYRGLISMQNFIFQTHDKNNYHHIQTASPKHVL